jgi:integrase/recombinase XerD
LAIQPGYKSLNSYTDTEYFNLSEKEVRIATARRVTAVPTLEQIKHVIETMTNHSAIERRNPSLIAFTLLTGARDSSIASMKLKHIDLHGNCVFQDAREVNTKFSKIFTTYFFPFGDEILEIVKDWVIPISQRHHPYAPFLKKPLKWLACLTSIHTVLGKRWLRLGRLFANRHKNLKAWSQNLGHEGVLTTLYSYEHVQEQRQGEILKFLKNPRGSGIQTADEIARAIVKAKEKSIDSDILKSAIIHQSVPPKESTKTVFLYLANILNFKLLI